MRQQPQRRGPGRQRCSEAEAADDAAWAEGLPQPAAEVGEGLAAALIPHAREFLEYRAAKAARAHAGSGAAQSGAGQGVGTVTVGSELAASMTRVGRRIRGLETRDRNANRVPVAGP